MRPAIPSRPLSVGTLLLLAAIAIAPAGCGSGPSSTGSPPAPPSPAPLAPTLATISPTASTAGGPALTLKVAGSGFVSGATVLWAGAPLVTSFVDSGDLQAVLPAANLAAAGNFDVSVTDGSGSVASGSVAFQVAAATAPSSSSLVVISIAANGDTGNADSTGPVLDSSGRYVAFISNATNLTGFPSAGFANVFLRDTCLGASTSCTPTTTPISVSLDGSALGNGNSSSSPSGLSPLAMNASGRYIAFQSEASNLIAADGNDHADIFLRDTCVSAAGCTPQTTRVSVTNAGAEANGASTSPSVDSTGRHIAFRSSASNLVSADANNLEDIFVRDTCLGAAAPCSPATTLVSVSTSGVAANGFSSEPSIDGSGRYVVFSSLASNLIDGQTYLQSAVYVRDTCAGALGCQPRTVLLSAGVGGQTPAGGSSSPQISADGLYVAFTSDASNLVSGSSGNALDVYLSPVCAAFSSCTSVTTRIVGAPAASSSLINSSPVLSADAQTIAFLSTPVQQLTITGPALAIASPTCIMSGACQQQSEVLSANASGQTANSPVGSIAISGDGSRAAFSAAATNLVSSDLHAHVQIFSAPTP